MDRFAAVLAPRLGPAWAVRDTRVSFDSTGWSVRCDATADGAPVVLLMSPPHASGQVRHPGFTLGVVDGAPRAPLEPAACDAVAEALAELRRRVRPEPAPSEPLDGRRARVLLGADGARLAPSIDAFRRHYGEPLRAVFLGGDRAPSIAFPPVAPEQELLMYAPPPFREDARMAAYLADLGFAVDARGRISTVPTPAAFARRRRRLSIDAEGLRPALRPSTEALFSPRAWLSQIADGVLPINVHGRLSHALTAPARAISVRLHRELRAYWNNHFHALGHDMGMHSLTMHRVPSAAMARMRAVAVEALRRGRAPSRRVATFFEERLTRTCHERWAEVTRPEGFARAFDAAAPALFDALNRELHGG